MNRYKRRIVRMVTVKRWKKRISVWWETHKWTFTGNVPCVKWISSIYSLFLRSFIAIIPVATLSNLFRSLLWTKEDGGEGGVAYTMCRFINGIILLLPHKCKLEISPAVITYITCITTNINTHRTLLTILLFFCLLVDILLAQNNIHFGCCDCSSPIGLFAIPSHKKWEMGRQEGSSDKMHMQNIQL